MPKDPWIEEQPVADIVGWVVSLLIAVLFIGCCIYACMKDDSPPCEKVIEEPRYEGIVQE